MQYAGDPIPARQPLGYHAEPDPYDPARWVIKATTELDTYPIQRGKSRLALRWYLMWYSTFHPIRPLP